MRDFMKIKLIAAGLLSALVLASCASSPVVRDKDLAADEALGVVSDELDQDASEAQDALEQLQADRLKEQQKKLERQITDPTFTP